MTASSSDLPLPPCPETGEGRLRRIGVELELIGLDIGPLAQLAADCLGGTIRQHSDYEYRIVGGSCGDWRVELDSALLKRWARDREDAPEDFLTRLGNVAEDVLRAGAERVVPLEIVSPPLPLDRLPLVEELIGRLRGAGARGTREGLAYAFSLQLNPELPATDAGTVRGYLKAFLCLFDWLRRESRLDLTRRLSFYTEPFPRDYVRRVVSPDYRPQLPQLIDDYLAANPTRNRALDLLPLFLHLEPDRVRAVVDDPRVKPRPTLHYRLPNCEVGCPDWGLADIWRQWLQVEHLAADPRRLERLCREYADFLDGFLSGLLTDWAQKVEPWLIPADDL